LSCEIPKYLPGHSCLSLLTETKDQPHGDLLVTPFRGINQCPPGASCYGRLKDLFTQLQDTQSRYDEERTACFQLKEKFDRLNQQHACLNQQLRVAVGQCRTGTKAFDDLQTAYHQQQDLLNRVYQERHISQSWNRERGRLDVFPNLIWETTKTLAQLLSFFLADQPLECSDDLRQDLRNVCEALKNA